MKTLFIIDCSGSVIRKILYHKEFEKIIDEYWRWYFLFMEYYN